MKTFISFLAIVIMFPLITPTLAHAERGSGDRDQEEERDGNFSREDMRDRMNDMMERRDDVDNLMQKGSMMRGNICEKVETAVDEVKKTHEDRRHSMEERRQKLEGFTKNMRGEYRTTINEKRTETDAHHADMMKRLEQLAGTDATKKAAVAEFQTTLKSLIAARRAAVDAAVTAYQDGILKLKDERTTAMSSWSTDNDASVQTALEAVRAACANGGDIKEAGAALRTAMQASRQEFKGMKSEFDFQSKLKALQQTRKDAIAKAVADFKTGFEAAKTKLKAALEPATGSDDDQDGDTNSSDSDQDGDN